ncbi:MAG: helix-turn-helix domain-containing protein [Clostridia bacterium]|nr:helix-turn-helix domain-containing protein [Clostridia bacterium]
MFGENLKRLRLARGLSQVELGQLTQLGQSNISAWERGERSPLPDGLMKLATFFECSIDDLLGYENRNIENDDAYILMQKYKSLDEAQKKRLNEYINSL